MNEVWNLDVIYRGFDDPAFAADMEKLEKLVQDYAAFAGAKTSAFFRRACIERTMQLRVKLMIK